MTMEHAAIRSEPVVTEKSEDEWPRSTLRDVSASWISGRMVTLGWRVKNFGFAKLGEWIVYKFHRGAGCSS